MQKKRREERSFNPLGLKVRGQGSDNEPAPRHVQAAAKSVGSAFP
jgi:hypothetical protein